MDYIPPIKPPIEHITPAAQQTRGTDERLIIYIDEAIYDQTKKQATITMFKAFQKSSVIGAYNGTDITLVYQDTTPNLEACPPVRVPTRDIKRHIDFFKNTVALTISNIPKSLADKISDTLCLLIDTETVKKVSNPSYKTTDPNVPKKPYSRLNE